MATKTLNSLKGRVIRFTRLDECGEPVIGACSSIVTAGFITVEFEAEKEDGEEYLQTNAWGDYCVNEKDRSRTKWYNVSMTMCEIDPDVLDLVGGGAAITDGTDTIGAAFGEDGNLAGFAIEVWTKQAGTACVGGDPEWGYFVAPFVLNGTIDGAITIENGTMELALMGEAQKATDAWGVNPYGDNPILAAAGFPEDKFVAVVRTTVQPPAVTDGCVALA